MSNLMTILIGTGTLGAALLAFANIWLLEPPLHDQKAERFRSQGGKR